jgi:hypothetical protein
MVPRWVEKARGTAIYGNAERAMFTEALDPPDFRPHRASRPNRRVRITSREKAGARSPNPRYRSHDTYTLIVESESKTNLCTADIFRLKAVSLRKT